MEALTVQLRRGDEDTIECWDDGDLQCADDIQFRSASTATSVTNSSIRRSGHRDSISSRRSARSDLDSIPGGDDDWQVLLHEHDELVTEDTISSARNAGIPIPENIPKSALIGGTIKRLGRRKTKKDFVDDWSEDVEFPGPDKVLELRTPQERTFPDSLRHINSTATSPVKAFAPSFWDEDVSVRLQSALTTLDKYREKENGSCIQGAPTIKVAKYGSPRDATPSFNPPSDRLGYDTESFDKDFDLPTDGLPLRLPSRKDALGTSSPTPEDFDIDWSEGSIGVRFGGTTRDRRSNPSSSVCVVSPSASSCLTGESEDDCLDGLVIPEGPLNLEISLKKQQDVKSAHPVDRPRELPTVQHSAEGDDFFSGIEIDDVDAFGSGKLTVNPNVKRKTERPTTPARRSATTITFTNTAVSPKTRIPRLSGHDRPHSTQLETVSESGAPISKFRRPQSRFGGHSAHSSISSFSPSSTPATALAQRSRRFIGARASEETSSGESISASTGVLKPKRSMPVVPNTHQVTSMPPLQHSPSRQGGASRSLSSTRPKTPIERIGNDVRSLNRRPLAPFIPAGASENQSHHVSVKTYRRSRRTNSDGSIDVPNPQGSTARTSRRGEPFENSPNETSPGTLIAAAKRTLTRPTKRRDFGDGTELESFDDLPTSASAERKFVKYPTGRGVPRSFRNKLGQNQSMSPRAETLSQPVIPVTASKPQGLTPRFARDTNASRNAREQRIASMVTNLKNREANPLASLSSNWRPQPMSRGSPNSATVRNKKEKSVALSETRPHLIKPLGTGVHEAKCELVSYTTRSLTNLTPILSFF